MKIHWQLFAGLALGLTLGLLWKPYAVEIQKLGPASAIVRINRLTGSAHILRPGNTHWTPVLPDVATDAAIPDWAK